MPGPNIVGIAVCVGAKMRGTIGTIAAVSGFLVIPWAIGLSVGLLFLEYAHLLVLRNILGGIAATAAGLLIATGIRLLLPHRRRPAALLFELRFRAASCDVRVDGPSLRQDRVGLTPRAAYAVARLFDARPVGGLDPLQSRHESRGR
jgi:chromate transporter